MLNNDDTNIVIENIEMSSKKSKRNLIIVFSLILIVTICTFIIIFSSTNKYDKYKVTENVFLSDEKLSDYGLYNINQIDGNNFFIKLSTFYSNIDNKDIYEDYARYIFDYLISSPYVTYVSFVVDRPEEADNVISYNQYLIKSNDFNDFRDSKGTNYKFYYFTNLTKDRNLKDPVSCHILTLRFYDNSLNYHQFNKDGEKLFYNFSMSLRDEISDPNSLYKYYIADEFYNIEKLKIDNDNFASYFPNIERNRELSNYSFYLRPAIYFAKGSIDLNLEVTLRKNENNIILSKTIERNVFITSCYGFSWYTSFQAEVFGFENLDNTNIEKVSINISDDSYFYICEKK